MAASKRDHMEVYDGLADRYFAIIQKMVEEEQMIYETLCDTRSKDK